MSYDLGVERTRRLKEITKKKGIFALTEDLTVYNIFAALLFVLLNRISGNHSLSYVSPFRNRPTAVLKNTIGLLMELCPLHIDISEEDSFISLIEKVSHETRETLRHYQHGLGIPLQNKAYDVILNYYRVPSLNFRGALVLHEWHHSGHQNESLALHVNDSAPSESFVLNFDFNCDVFNKGEHGQTVKHFVQLIDGFLENTDQPISRVNLPLIKEKYPISPSSKRVRQTLHVPDQSRAGLERAFIAPRDELELQLTKIWEKIFDTKPIGVRDNFFELGGNSLSALSLFAEIEKIFGKKLPLSTLFQMSTIEELANILRQEGWSASWSSLVAIQSGGPKPPFFCVHGGGGYVLRFRDLALYLGLDQPFYGLQAQGLDGKKPPHTRIEDMATHYIKEIRTIQPEGPYFLGGFSSGGIVALEMAQQFYRQGQKVAFLAMLDTYGPGYYKPLSNVMSLPDKFDRFTGKVGHYMGHLFQLRHSERPVFLLNIVKKKIWRIVYKSPIRRLTPAIRKVQEANIQAMIRYIPQPYPDKLTFFRASKQPKYYPDPQLDWIGLASRGLEIQEVPGYHSSMIVEPYVRDLAEKLKACLNTARIAVAGR